MSENSERSIKEWAKLWNDGEFRFKDGTCDVHKMIEAGWYDWFARDETLCNRLDRMAPYVLEVAEILDAAGLADDLYVWFKNNQPAETNATYDDFRIADRKTGNTMFTITPKNVKTRGGQAELWAKANDFNGPVVKGSMTEVLGAMKALVALQKSKEKRVI